MQCSFYFFFLFWLLSSSPVTGSGKWKINDSVCHCGLLFDRYTQEL